jgi:hypothetical protein
MPKAKRQRVHFDANPAVQTVLENGKEQEQRRRQKRQRRRRPSRRKKYAQFNVALDPRVKGMVKQIANVEGVSASGVIELMVALGARAYIEQEGLMFEDVVRGSHTNGASPDWVVEVKDLDQLVWDLEKFLEGE